MAYHMWTFSEHYWSRGGGFLYVCEIRLLLCLSGECITERVKYVDGFISVIIYTHTHTLQEHVSTESANSFQQDN